MGGVCGVEGEICAFVGVVAYEDWDADEGAAFEVVVEVVCDEIPVDDGEPIPQRQGIVARCSDEGCVGGGV